MASPAGGYLARLAVVTLLWAAASLLLLRGVQSLAAGGGGAMIVALSTVALVGLAVVACRS